MFVWKFVCSSHCHQTKRRACYAKRKLMSPSATPATSDNGAKRELSAPPEPAQCVPRLLRKVKVDVAKCHTCHASCVGSV